MLSFCCPWLKLCYDNDVGRVTAALTEEGFPRVTATDIGIAFAERIGVALPDDVLPGADNLPQGGDALRREQEMGALRRCDMVLYHDVVGGSVVRAADPQTMSGNVRNAKDRLATRPQSALWALSL